MGPSHRYDLIKESDDDNRESADIKDDPQPRSNLSAIPPWWKIVFYIVLVFSAGIGAGFGVGFASIYFKSKSSATENATTSTTAAAQLEPTPSATFSTDVSIPTSLIEHLENETNRPDGLDNTILDCGYSPSQARERGCVYDVMMQDWVPEPCYDGVLTEKYLARGNYTWYTDTDGHTMSDEEMRKGEHGMAWMTASYHKAHCVFSWEKLIRALRNNRGISQELLSYDHVLHCEHQTLGGDHHKREEPVGVGAPTNYAKCALYNTWKNDFIPDKHSSTD